MADALQGLASFPGIFTVKSSRYSLVHGITPSVATLTIVPQATLPARDGALEFTFGSTRIVLEGFRIDFLSATRNDQGEIYQISLFDRRWKWQAQSGGGHISGHYNLRLDDGEVDPELEKTPQQLASLCLEAMGERRGSFDVRQMPNVGRPEVVWDFENPSMALASLCESLGCRVVLGIDNRVTICRLGVGASLPIDDDVMELTGAFNPPERPDSLLFVAGTSSFQVDLVLFPVGKENDGSIKYIEDLSYKPPGGWHTCEPLLMAKVADDRDRKLALQSVFRWYMIDHEKNPDGSGPPLEIPGYGAITWLEQILPIDGLLNEAVAADDDEDPHFIDAFVWGTYWPYAISPDDTPPRTFYTWPYEIDAAEGIVKFDRPVVRYIDIGPAGRLPQPPKLYLRCTVQVHDVNTWAIEHYTQEQLYPGPHLGTGQRLVKSDDVYLRVIPEYDPNTYRMLRTTDNEEELRREATYRFAAADQEYQATSPQEVTYRGIRPFSTDGAIQSVTWETSDESPARTRVARNDEFNATGMDYKERRRLERISRPQWEKIIEKLWNMKDLASQRHGDRLARAIFGI